MIKRWVFEMELEVFLYLMDFDSMLVNPWIGTTTTAIVQKFPQLRHIVTNTSLRDIFRRP